VLAYMNFPAQHRTSVSLGLITTELVINALKHAFPGRHEGRVIVKYDCGEGGWRLLVADNGVGFETRNRGRAQSGLGTSLVEVLARQLHARVEISTSPSGTTVSVLQSN
jgi:two-component system, sensor histidine kinase PdtaS